MPPSRRGLAGLALFVLVTASAGACGSGKGDGFVPGGDDASTGDGAANGEGGLISGDGSIIHGDAQAFDVQPAPLQSLTVKAGQTTPTVLYKATLGGNPVKAGWQVDRGDIGSIGAGPAAQTTFAPTGTTGGLVDVSAAYSGQTLQRQVFVKLTQTQNGANPSAPGEGQQIPGSVGALSAGGGVGGVGGEGLGGPVTDPGTLGALQNPTNNGQTQGLTFLYPYDKTVWPRGLLAPLLQWTWSTGDADAIAITLRTTSGSFSYTGTFARPAILGQTGGAFIRHPIPQDVWTMATDSAGGPTPNKMLDQLVVSLVVAKNGQGYGPITETWTVAPGRLEGTVYYNSYGTHLVQNSIEASYNGGPQFGAAVLGIQEGATGPAVVAGTPSPLGSGAGCRVCHVVASGGSTLIAQHGDNYALTSAYDLLNGNAETVLSSSGNLFGWAGLSADGKLAMSNTGDLAASTSASQLYAFPPASTTPLTVTGIPANLKAGTPAFSPDGKHVAFDFLGGTIGGTAGNGTQLVALDYDATTKAFSNLKPLVTMTGGMRAGFPSFFPTNDAVAFHYQLVNSNHLLNTWNGAKAQIWWSDLATGTAQELYALNGHDPGGTTSYLPTSAANHGDDTVLNYEPTASPVASGGYIWVIFTSRRLYGNTATTDPWQSDPRNYDATVLANATCKKLWVAAIDLNAKPGTDPSHPAFYLPAQELLAGNARGFWVISPCKANGQGCQSGDECCNGYCQSDADGGLVCGQPSTTCSQPQNKCTTAADCCDKTNLCVNGFCSVATPQ